MTRSWLLGCALALGVVACGSATKRTADVTTAHFAVTTLALPGGGPDGVAMDYLAFDPETATIWVPAGNTGSVDVIDTKSGKISRIDGFATQQLEGRGGKTRTVGPSSVTFGEGIVYVGNRGDFTVCTIDPKKLERVACGPKLDSMPDGIAFVAATQEVWVTTPRDKSIRILDARTLAQKERIAFEGSPEGYAVDARRGRFYTNLEDKDVTLAIDSRSRKTLAQWPARCGEDGPHGLRLAEPDLLFVACSDKIESMDLAHDGAIVSTIGTGDGVDDLDYAPATRLIYAGAAKAASLAIVRVDAHGALSLEAKVPTAEGARNAAVDASGKVYLSHAKGSEILVVTP